MHSWKNVILILVNSLNSRVKLRIVFKKRSIRDDKIKVVPAQVAV